MSTMTKAAKAASIMNQKKVVRDSHVAIVGGSIAGCASALALASANDKSNSHHKIASITILERSSAAQLEDRGQGIGMMNPHSQNSTPYDSQGESLNES